MNSSLLSRLDSPKVSLGIVAIVYLFFIVARLAMHGYDPSYFITAGDEFCNPDLVPGSLQVQKDSSGYDGQFYYRLALNPFTSKQTDFGVRLDNPPYRQQRIAYPLIVWALSLGRFDFVPIMMIVVNYIALCLMGWIGGHYVRSMKQHALWGLVFPIYPGFLLSLSRDLPEALAVFFILASLLLIRKGKHLFATFLLVFAILTKETALLVAAGALFVWYIRTCEGKSNNKLKWYFFLVPFVFYSIWQLLLLYRWGDFPLFGGCGNIGLPFHGFIRFFKYTLALETDLQQLWFTELCFIIAFTVSVVCFLRSTGAWIHEKISWLFYGILMLLLTCSVWVEDWTFLRALSEFYVLGSIIIIGSQFKIKFPIFAWSSILWLFLFTTRMR